jgi:hypothetical protein
MLISTGSALAFLDVNIMGMASAPAATLEVLIKSLREIPFCFDFLFIDCLL